MVKLQSAIWRFGLLKVKALPFKSLLLFTAKFYFIFFPQHDFTFAISEQTIFLYNNNIKPQSVPNLFAPIKTYLSADISIIVVPYYFVVRLSQTRSISLF